MANGMEGFEDGVICCSKNQTNQCTHQYTKEMYTNVCAEHSQLITCAHTHVLHHAQTDGRLDDVIQYAKKVTLFETILIYYYVQS